MFQQCKKDELNKTQKQNISCLGLDYISPQRLWMIASEKEDMVLLLVISLEIDARETRCNRNKGKSLLLDGCATQARVVFYYRNWYVFQREAPLPRLSPLTLTLSLNSMIKPRQTPLPGRP